MVSAVYGVSLFWINVILSMLSKDLKNKKNVTFIEQFFINFTNLLKHNQLFLIFGIVTWSFFLPVTLNSLGFTPYHIIYNDFRLV